jgi:SAM-dependent methyltransferase
MNQDPPEYATRYGDNCADFYDEIYGPVEPNVVATLDRLANGGRVLELGIATGRVALPLASRGVDVHGVEASSAMLAKLQEKPGAANLPVVQANFVDFNLEGSFSLIFVLVSTFFLLPSREEQQQCFHTIARMLSKQGVFLIESYEPIGATPDGGADQEMSIAQQVVKTRNGPREYRVHMCYAPPAELDEMAYRADLRLRERWSNWRRRPYEKGSPMSISLYQRGAIKRLNGE